MKSFTYWGDRLKKKSDGTDPLLIETEQVDRGCVFHVQSVSLVDETTVNKLLEIGIKRGGEYHPIVKRTAASSDYSLAPNVKNQVLIEGEQLYGKVHAPTSGDVCHLVFGGQLYLRE